MEAGVGCTPATGSTVGGFIWLDCDTWYPPTDTQHTEESIWTCVARRPKTEGKATEIIREPNPSMKSGGH